MRKNIEKYAAEETRDMKVCVKDEGQMGQDRDTVMRMAEIGQEWKTQWKRCKVWRQKIENRELGGSVTSEGIGGTVDVRQQCRQDEIWATAPRSVPHARVGTTLMVSPITMSRAMACGGEEIGERNTEGGQRSERDMR